MASKTPALPKRFQPFVAQAQTAADLQYGPQEAAFQTILGNAQHDYSQQAAAQAQGTSSLVAALKGAQAATPQIYSNVGLTPTLLSQLAASGSPTAQRLAAEAASAQTAVQSQALGAQAGGQYQAQHLFDQYQQDVGNTNQQITAEQASRGEYTAQQLQGLISDDRSARSAANAAAKAQDFTAQQNALKNTQTEANALINQGVTPTINSDGSITVGAPIPGAKSNKPKAKPSATPAEQAGAESDFALALQGATAALSGQAPSKHLANQTISQLVQGLPASSAKPGKTVYENVPVYDQYGKQTGTKRQPKLDPKTGTVVTTGGTEAEPAIKPVNPAIAQAAVEMAAQGYLSASTVKELHRLGYQVNGLPGVKTWTQRNGAKPLATPPKPKATTPKPKTPAALVPPLTPRAFGGTA